MPKLWSIVLVAVFGIAAAGCAQDMKKDKMMKKEEMMKKEK